MLILEEFLSLKQIVKIALESNFEAYWAQNDFGSKLFLFLKEKLNNQSMMLFDSAIKEALQFLIEDGLVFAIEVEVIRTEKTRVNFMIALKKPDGQNELLELAYAI